MQMNDLVAKNLRSAINASGMKQKAVAERSGFTDQMLTDMLNGRKTIKADFIPRICRALHVTPNELFGWE